MQPNIDEILEEMSSLNKMWNRQRHQLVKGAMHSGLLEPNSTEVVNDSPWSVKLHTIDGIKPRSFRRPLGPVTDITKPIPLEVNPHFPPSTPDPWKGSPTQPETPYHPVPPKLDIPEHVKEGDSDLENQIEEFLEIFANTEDYKALMDTSLKVRKRGASSRKRFRKRVHQLKVCKVF